MPLKKAIKTQTETTTTEDILANMARDSNIRTVEKSKKLEHAYKSSLQRLEEQIEDVVDKDRREISTLRTSQLRRLHTLIRRRAEIESQLSASIGNLATAYEIVNKQVRHGLKYRAGDLHEALERTQEDGGGDEEDEEPVRVGGGAEERGRGEV